jgi:hypothetical protein
VLFLLPSKGDETRLLPGYYEQDTESAPEVV